MILQTSTRGHILVPTLMVLATVAALIGVAVNFTTHQGRLARNSRDFTAAISVADGELERLYDGWKQLLGSVPMGDKATPAQLDTISSPVPAPQSVHPGFAGAQLLTSFRGNPTHTLREVDAFGAAVPAGKRVTNTGPLPGYAGFFAINTTYDARVAVSFPSLRHRPEVEIGRTFTKSEAPIFQAAIFFEDDLELHPGEKMIVAGPVITNHRMFAAGMKGKGLDFSSYVSYNKDYSYAETPPAATGYSAANYTPPVYTSSKATQLNKADRLEPAGREMRDAFNKTDTNPNNDGFRELIEKPAVGFTDPATIAPFRFYTQASLKISIRQAYNGATWVQTVTVLGKNNLPVNPTVQAKVAAAIADRKALYDRREQIYLGVTPVDVAKLGDAIMAMNSSTNASERFNGIVYFSDDSPDTYKHAFRLENGAKLPTYDRPVDAPSSERGFSVATDAGLYIKGDYNSYAGAPQVPSAVLADAVMILSNNWDDARSANPLYGIEDPDDPSQTVPNSERLATETTVRTAIMAGYIPTGYDPTPTVPSNGDNYGASGGAHNFPRFLENWANVNFNFKGSMVQLFTSQTFTGPWKTADIYTPPNRNWSYNEEFTKRPSPGLFAFNTYSRGPWKRF